LGIFLVNHTNAKTFEHGHEQLYNSLVSIDSRPSSDIRSVRKRHFITHKVNPDRFVVVMGLLLAGDIHPCRGPVNPMTNQDSSFNLFKRIGLHCLHINVRSLPPKIDEIRTIDSTTNAAIIGVTESWLDDTIFDSEIEIPNYHLERKDRNREGGGPGVEEYMYLH
jgi:hypothetical protein